ncbi:RagB/SusD family nutrient uptake outer membrane protein [termite gut metagenome]|uniref:RagB/SusD family nutrient uptake outer membrane protein n=1 Tax=termite gut metagenome TaxID=433724 RepID=A0A5J4S761_9ZZZZ
MRSIIKCIICLFAGIFVSSCDDYLDVTPDQIPTIESAFADRYTTLQYLGSCYWAMPRLGGWDSNPAWIGSMEMIVNKEYQTESYMQLALGNNTPTVTYFWYWGYPGNNSTRSLYAGIRECNTFLDNVGQVPDMPIQEKNREIAEAKTLKAYMHFWLLRQYGPICPLRESPPVSESIRGVQVYREKVDTCFAYIIHLLDEVVDSQALPEVITNKTSELGRFTHAAACALRAEVWIYWASPLFNGNQEYNDFLDHNGEHFFNQKKDESRWAKASEACRVAVEACAAGGIRLFQIQDYITQQKMSDETQLVNTLRSSVTEQWNSNVETIWGSTSSPMGSSMQLNCIAQLEGGNSNVVSTVSVPFSTVDLFYSSNGVPIEEDTAWVNSGRYDKRFSLRAGDTDHQYYVAIGEKTADMNFDREPRFYSTLGFDRGKWHSNMYSYFADEQTPFLKNRWNEYSSYRNSSNYNVTGYFPKKLVSLASIFMNANSFDVVDYPSPDMRYASLLLFYAEALNETTQGEDERPTDEVYALIDEVRARAGLEGVIDSWKKYADSNKPLTKRGMREIIQRERKIELACEGQYFWDSRRWQAAQKEQNRLIQGWNVKAMEESGYYTPTTIYIQKFTRRDYFFPIPESDMINNPKLIQNPGW